MPGLVSAPCRGLGSRNHGLGCATVPRDRSGNWFQGREEGWGCANVARYYGGAGADDRTHPHPPSLLMKLLIVQHQGVGHVFYLTDFCRRFNIRPVSLGARESPAGFHRQTVARRSSGFHTGMTLSLRGDYGIWEPTAPSERTRPPWGRKRLSYGAIDPSKGRVSSRNGWSAGTWRAMDSDMPIPTKPATTVAPPTPPSHGTVFLLFETEFRTF